jgi:UrcA family protein
MLSRGLITAAAFAVALPAQAASPPLPAERTVSAAHVDFGDAAAVDDLYARLKAAAAAVCDGYAANSRVTRDEIVCADRALGDAVRQLNRPALSARYTRGAAAGR